MNLESMHQIDSFDLILFQGTGTISRCIMGLTNSDVSHVAAVWKRDGVQFCFESTTLSNIPCAVTGALTRGVQLVPLKQRVMTYEGKIWWRQLKGYRTKDMRRAYAAVMAEFIGTPYEENQIELLKSALDHFQMMKNQPDTSSLFCSELVKVLYDRAGVTYPTEEPANEFTPADFNGEDIPLTETFSLMPRIEIEHG